MDIVKGKLHSLKIQDAVLVVICILLIYLLRVKEQFILKPAWHMGTKSNNQEEQPFQSTPLPRPIVTDLDGDGHMEVILISQGHSLAVCQLQGSSQTKQIPELTVIHKVVLPVYENEDGRTSRPVTMETGYFTEYQSAEKMRSQYIVVAMDNWVVVCYDHTLSLLWQQKMMDVGQVHDQYIVKAMSVLIAPVHLHRDDTGVVIIGASFGHKDHNTRMKKLSKEDEVKSTKPDDNKGTFTHFSTFALSGSNGTLRWHHLPGDFEKKSNQDLTAYHWKLQFKRTTHHIGEAHWSKYQSTLLRHMVALILPHNTQPHQWSVLADTRFDLADIKQVEDTLTSVQTPTPLVDILAPPDEHLPGLFYGGDGPHSRHDHVLHPNVLIIHNDEGMEVLRLHTGQPLTRLSLAQYQAVYADVDEDGSLEQLFVKASGESCFAHLSTIHPKPRAVFSVPVCEALQWSGSNSYMASSVQVITNEDIRVPPVLVKSIAKKRGFVNHLLGRSLHSERRGYDSIYVTSFGRVTSYSSDGELNWQTMSEAQWTQQATKATNDPDFEGTKEGQVYHNSFLPSAVPMSIKVFGKETVAVVTGWQSMSLIDLRDGHVLVEHSLPCQPSDKPIAADFTTDGLTDIIVTCPKGYLGFTVHARMSYFYMALVSTMVTLCVLLLSWCCQPDHYTHHHLDH